MLNNLHLLLVWSLSLGFQPEGLITTDTEGPHPVPFLKVAQISNRLSKALGNVGKSSVLEI